MKNWPLLRLFFTKAVVSGILFAVINAKASELAIVNKSQLRVGDIVLISLNCMQCRYIESETGAPFSHSGIILSTNPSIKIGQALGVVHSINLGSFIKHITPNSKVLIVRSRESETNTKFKDIEKIFYEKFLELPFDSEYLWNNLDKNGKEKIYCSELVHKLLNEVLDTKLVPQILIYSKHYDYWLKVFNGTVPNNELGNSPSSFYRDSTNFEIIGQLGHE